MRKRAERGRPCPRCVFHISTLYMRGYDLFLGKPPGFTGFKVRVQFDMTYTDPVKRRDAIADGVEHALYLMIASFVDGKQALVV